VQTKTGLDTQCCGTKGYDPELFTCCGGEIKPGRKFGMECCNSIKVYNKTKEICCNKVVHMKGIDVDCCGADLYNKKLKLCCNNLLLDTSGGFYTACCGSFRHNPSPFGLMGCCFDQMPYNKNTHVCCSGGRVTMKQLSIYYTGCI